MTRLPLQSKEDLLLYRLFLTSSASCCGSSEVYGFAQLSPDSSSDNPSNNRDLLLPISYYSSYGLICIPGPISSSSFSRQLSWPFDTQASCSRIAPYAWDSPEKNHHNANTESLPSPLSPGLRKWNNNIWESHENWKLDEL